MPGEFTTPRQVLADRPREPEQPLSLTWVHHSERSSTAVVDVGPGGGLDAHIHRDHDEIVMILEGEAEFRLGDEVHTVRAGDVVSVPAGTVHAPLRSEDGCVLVSVFAPWFDPDQPDRVFIDS